ncbi:MAG: PorV/PorQ family protein [Elusimicrobia bacterium]|nr:PorV/PorQ family protein [Elusimicrobiota bacterium]
MRTRALLTTFLAAALAAPCAAATGTAGADPFAFLALDANARPVALGGAYTALASDANALLYNPGGLGLVRAHEATFMHNQYFAGITQDYAAFASRGGWSASINHLGLGKVPRTTLSNPDGDGTVSYSDLALEGGYGHALTDSLSVGAGVKYIRESFDIVGIQAYALDLGALYSVGPLPGLTVGVAAQNIGPATSRTREQLPRTFRAGTAYTFTVAGSSQTVAVDVMKERVENAFAAVGVETYFLKPLALRFGYNTANAMGTGLSVGFGYSYRGLGVDYAYVPLGPAGDAHRISVTARWGAR